MCVYLTKMNYYTFVPSPSLFAFGLPIILDVTPADNSCLHVDMMSDVQRIIASPVKTKFFLQRKNKAMQSVTKSDYKIY